MKGDPLAAFEVEPAAAPCAAASGTPVVFGVPPVRPTGIPVAHRMPPAVLPMGRVGGAEWSGRDGEVSPLKVPAPLGRRPPLLGRSGTLPRRPPDDELPEHPGERGVIREVSLRGFKRFGEVDFRLPGHAVLAGPNNTGKTTVLQAIAAWAFALRHWEARVGERERYGYGYDDVPVSRQTFSVVPLRAFDLLWKDRVYRGVLEVGVRHDSGSAKMEFRADSHEQIHVRPAADAGPEILERMDFPVVFAPPMDGIAVEEPLYHRPKSDQLLAFGRPGETLRNLLVEARESSSAWEALVGSVERLFGYRLLPPDASGPHVVAEYRPSETAQPLDIASAGSGFHQVLMLLALLNVRPGAVLLLDEPDAHLHLILQNSIWRELRRVAARQRSQLICATHSEAIVDAVEPRDLCILLDRPRMAADDAEKSRLLTSLRVLSNTDIVQMAGARGILYVEDYTDWEILGAWASRLGHRAERLLATELMWKPVVFETERGVPGIRSRDHFEALRLAGGHFVGLELRDGDARPTVPETAITGAGLQRLRWRRYEIESYLLHPEALARFVERETGGDSSAVAGFRDRWRRDFPAVLLEDPFATHPYVRDTKARTEILPPLLGAAGLGDLSHTRYTEIAALMEPAEIHPEVVEKLDAICRAFGEEP